MSRRIITAVDIDSLARAGEGRLQLGPQDLLTDMAAARARDLGIEVCSTAPAPPLAAQVHAGVVAALGHEPAGLAALIERVLAGEKK